MGLRLMRHDEKQKELEIKNFGITKNRISALEVINHVQAKEFINPGAPPVWKLPSGKLT